MESGSPEGGALTHMPLLTAGMTRRKRKVRTVLTREDVYYIEISSAFKKMKTPPCPRNNGLTTACSQCETATASNSCSCQWTCVQSPPPQFPLLYESNSLSLVLRACLWSTLVSLPHVALPLLFPKKTHFASKISIFLLKVTRAATM